MIPFFSLLETPAELKINLSCTVPCSALNCTVVQWWTLHVSSVLYCTILYCTIQFCNTLYCIVMYWSLMQSMVLSLLLQKGVAVTMCIAPIVKCHTILEIQSHNISPHTFGSGLRFKQIIFWIYFLPGWGLIGCRIPPLKLQKGCLWVP